MMDTLLTTFLTTTPIMVPTWALFDSSTLIEKYIVELDFMSMSLNKNQADYDDGSDYFEMNLSLKKNGGEGDYCTKEYKNEMCISPFIMEFHNIPNNPQSSPSPSRCPSKALDNSPFYWYFQHQLRHMAVNRRMQTLQTSKCCSSFGMMSNCSQREHHCCCKVEYSKTMMYRDVDEAPAPCPCELQEGERFCDIHGIVIQDIEMMSQSCMWTISFHQTLDEDEGDEDEDEYFVNPGYEDECENNLLDDTFEIEFTNDVHSSFNAFELTNVNFISHTIHNVDEVFDIYEFNDSNYSNFNDTNCSNFIYELSDDEEDCNMIFDSGLVVSQSWSADFAFSTSNTNKVKKQRTKSFHQNTFPLRPKNKSKYHTKCTHTSNVVDNDNNNNNSNRNINKRTDRFASNKGKKKVHFPEDDDELVTVHRLVTWAHAHKEARKSVWFRRAQERCHFRRRIMNVSELLNPVLKRKLNQLENN